MKVITALTWTIFIVAGGAAGQEKTDDIKSIRGFWQPETAQKDGKPFDDPWTPMNGGGYLIFSREDNHKGLLVGNGKKTAVAGSYVVANSVRMARRPEHLRLAFRTNG